MSRAREVLEMLAFYGIFVVVFPLLIVATILGVDRSLASWMDTHLIPDSWRE